MNNVLQKICVSAKFKSESDLITKLVAEITPNVKVISFESVLKDIAKLNDVDFIFTVGGDGSVSWLIRKFFETFQRVDLLKPIVPIVRPKSIGYLRQIDLDEKKFARGYKKILQRKYSIIDRMILSTTIRGKKRVAVNEIYLSCTPHLGKFRIRIKEQPEIISSLTDAKADGILITTPIGSSGWGLSYNGYIGLDENSLQVIFIGKILPAANFILPRKPVVIKLELKNSSITNETIIAYNNTRKRMGLEEDASAESFLNVIYGSRLIIDGKIVEFDVDSLEIASNLSAPFVFLQKQTNFDKVRKLTSSRKTY